MKKIIGLILIMSFMTWILPAVAAEDTSFRKAKITSLEGDVVVRMAGTENWINAKKDMILTQDDEIRTGVKSYATLIFDEKGSFESENKDSVEIDEDTELVISKALYNKTTNTKTTLLQLNLGKIVSSAAKLEGDSKFEVETPTTIVGVRGTKYTVEYRPEQD